MAQAHTLGPVVVSTIRSQELDTATVRSLEFDDIDAMVETLQLDDFDRKLLKEALNDFQIVQYNSERGSCEEWPGPVGERKERGPNFEQGSRESALREKLHANEVNLGADHPETARSVNNLATLLKTMGRLEEAEPLYRRVLELKEANIGTDHSSITTPVRNLATLLKALDRLEEAEPLYRRLLYLKEANHGADHPETAKSAKNLGNLLREMGRLDDAENMLRRGIRILEARFGQDHPQTTQSAKHLEILLKEKGRDAGNQLDRKVQFARKKTGPRQSEEEQIAGINIDEMAANRTSHYPEEYELGTQAEAMVKLHG